MGDRSTRADRRLWLTPAGAVAAGLIVVQAVWRGILLGRGYYGQDDFLVLSGAVTKTVRDAFDADHAGSFSPGAQLLARAQTAVSPMDWSLAALTTLALQAVAAALMWTVLTKLMGSHWARLPVLVAFCFTPLTLWSTQWWSAALVFWPATVLLLAAACAVLHAPDSAVGMRLRWLAVGAVVAALLFTERALLQPVVLVGLALLAHHRASAGSRGWLFAAWRDERWTWAGYMAVLGAYVAVRAVHVPVRTSAGSDLGQVVTTYIRHVAAGLVGGPWAGELPGHAYLVPKSWAVGAGAVLFLALVAVTLQRGGVAARIAWITLVVYSGLGLVLLAEVGQRDLFASLGLVHRFAADLGVVAAICAGAALSSVALPELRVSGYVVAARLVERIAGTVVVVLLAVSASVSTALLAPNVLHREARSYVDHVRADLRENPQAVLLDASVPNEVMSTWFAGKASVSTVLAAAPEHAVFDIPSHNMRIVQPSGRLASLNLSGAVEVEPSSNRTCGHPVRSDGQELQMRRLVPTGAWILRLGYYTSTDTFGTIAVADQAIRFPVRQGLNAVDIPVRGSFDRFEVSIENPDSTLCLATATAGAPVAAAP